MSLKEFIPKPETRRQYYLPQEIEEHNTATDCFVSFFYKVYDLSRFVQENVECNDLKVAPMAELLVKFAG
jgi:hypothetical protein